MHDKKLAGQATVAPHQFVDGLFPTYTQKKIISKREESSQIDGAFSS